MPRIRPTQVAIVAGALVVAAFGVAGKTLGSRATPLAVAVGLLIGALFVGSGLVAAARWAGNRTGTLLVVAGYAWLAEDLVTSDLGPVYAVGQFLQQATAGPLAHLVLAHPTGRLGSRAARVAVGVAYVAGLGLPAVSLLFLRPVPECNCPGNPFVVADLPEVANAILRVQQGLFAATLLLIATLMVRRWAAADPLSRRDLAWVYGPALAYGAVSLADSASRSLWNAGIPVLVQGLGTVFLLSLPVGFLAGTLRADAARAATGRLAEALDGTSGLRDALARALDDPALVVGVWDQGTATHRTADGAPVHAGPDRAGTEVRAGERPLALLVHDPALAREPGALRAAAAVTRLVLDPPEPASPHSVARLSSREREVLALMAGGLSNRTIAARLTLSERTVETHVRSIFLRLDLPADERENRRVRAVLAYLGAGAAEARAGTDASQGRDQHSPR